MAPRSSYITWNNCHNMVNVIVSIQLSVKILHLLLVIWNWINTRSSNVSFYLLWKIFLASILAIYIFVFEEVKKKCILKVIWQKCFFKLLWISNCIMPTTCLATVKTNLREQIVHFYWWCESTNHYVHLNYLIMKTFNS